MCPATCACAIPVRFGPRVDERHSRESRHCLHAGGQRKCRRAKISERDVAATTVHGVPRALGRWTLWHASRAARVARPCEFQVALSFHGPILRSSMPWNAERVISGQAVRGNSRLWRFVPGAAEQPALRGRHRLSSGGHAGRYGKAAYSDLGRSCSLPARRHR